MRDGRLELMRDAGQFGARLPRSMGPVSTPVDLDALTFLYTRACFG
jgi:hypothetical protein